MSFLSPLMLLGALGIAVPVIIHLIGRRQARVVRFAAFDFLMGKSRKTARRLELRDLLLLLVRVAICLAIPLALAKPFTSCATRGPHVARGPQAAVIVIDDSFAAGLDAGGTTLVETAKEQALRILGQLGSEADVAVLRSAEDSPSPTELSRDHLRLGDTIREIRPSARPADTFTALRRAGQLLSASSHERRTVYLISLLARSGFRPGSNAPWPADTGPTLVVVDVTEDATGGHGAGALANLAVTDMSVERDAASGSRGVRVLAELANFGPRPVVDHDVRLRIEGREVARGQVTLRPGERQSKQFLATLPTGSRFADVVVELAPDALPIDDHRHVRTELREEVRVLLVNGDPHTVRYQDELFYIEAALRPGDRGDSGTVLTTVTVDELAAVRLADFDVAVLANVRAMNEERVARLAAWVQAGGGLLVATGDNVNADAYNRTMQPLLPQTLRSLLDVAYGGVGAERAERAVRLTKWEAEHPIFAVFSKDAPGLREARFDKVLLLGPTTRVDDRRVLARYTNGAAALVEARSGAGRLMLFTSSLDRDWNDLSIHPGYLPLMQRTVRYLARKQDQRSRATVLVGHDVLVPVNAEDTRIEIRSPDGTRTVLEGERVQERKYVRFSGANVPGFYRVLAAGQRGEPRRRPESDFAVNIAPQGSDLTPLAAADLPASGPGTTPGNAGAHERRVELWHAIAAGLLLLLLLESGLILLRS